MTKGLKFIPLILLVILLDQFSKVVINALFTELQPMPITYFFNITLLYNSGAAFSFLADAGGWQKFFLIALSSVISIALLIWLASLKVKESRMLCYALSLILGGAIGNLIDRIIYGHVVDFLDFYWQQYHWPVFNVADICISMGMFFLLLDTWKSKSKVKRHKQ